VFCDGLAPATGQPSAHPRFAATTPINTNKDGGPPPGKPESRRIVYPSFIAHRAATKDRAGIYMNIPPSTGIT
jgi:hypothetical protein